MVEKPDHERRISLLEQSVRRFEGILDGDHGLDRIVRRMATLLETRERDKAIYDERMEKKAEINRSKLNIIIALGILIFAAAAFGWGVFLYERTTHSKILSSDNPAYASRQDAGLR